jgi:hypothetical protein
MQLKIEVTNIQHACPDLAVAITNLPKLRRSPRALYKLSSPSEWCRAKYYLQFDRSIPPNRGSLPKWNELRGTLPISEYDKS